MKKGFIILGGPGSGKTRTAFAIARNYKYFQFFDGRNIPKLGSFYYQKCDEDTDIIVFDNIPNTDCFDHFYGGFVDGVDVNKPQREGFTIHPDMIFGFASGVTIDQLPPRVNERFIIIDFNETTT